jgi:hypothetical protein
VRRVTTTYKFTEYRYPVSKKFPCDRCGRKVRRRTTFTGTANPFTRPIYMSYSEMRTHLRPAIDKWLAETGLCGPCSEP